jgi:nucleotide-binding universal stress UspA family protein
MQQLLACLDSSAYADGVLRSTSWAARRLGCAVELLHVIQRDDSVAKRHDHSGAVGLGAKSQLLEELATLDEQHARLERERGKLLLQSARQQLEAAGIAEVTTTHRHGGIVETVIEREQDASLVVVGKRGESSQFAKGHLGSQVERILRESIRPVLVTHPEPAAEPEKVFICFDNGRSAWRAVEFAATSPLVEGLAIHVAMAARHARDKNDEALDRVRETLPGAEVTQLEGSPDTVLPEAWVAGATDLVLMGAYGHSPLRRWIVGSTTTMLLRTARVPVLVFR